MGERTILADARIEDKVRILKQNAEQILAVVKETFTGYTFEGRSMQADCTNMRSDGEVLDCLWSQASVELAAGTHSVESKTLPALMQVRYLPQMATSRKANRQ